MRSETDQPLLCMRGMGKAFAGTWVLRDVDLTLEAGQIHALVGENGAGKSTLIKLLGGVYRPDGGEIVLRGRIVRFGSPRQAEEQGIAIIHQELALIPHLSVAENIFLGREPVTATGVIDRVRLNRAAEALLAAKLGLTLDVTQAVGGLPIGVQQMVEIAKALSREASVLVMDEPTSALSDADTRRLFEVVRQLREAGVAIVYISHKMDEIYALADRITVLRDGRHVGTATPKELPRDRLVHWMVGRPVNQFFPKHEARRGSEQLAVAGLALHAPDRGHWLLRDVSLHVRAGEILGLAGLMGSGASELLAAIYGSHDPSASGEIRIAGRCVARPTPADSLRRGVAFLTNDRKANGLVLPMSVLQNISLATLQQCRRYGWLDGGAEVRWALPLIQRLRLQAPALDAEVATLSGGNQQKVILARWLLTRPRVLLLDEPTRGIDVGAKADIYELLNELTRAGVAIILITSELPELLALADRIVVMHRGRVTEELTRSAATQERIMHAALGAASGPA